MTLSAPKFKIDENLPEEAADLLEQAGFDARTVRQEGLTGVGDPILIGARRKEGRALVTPDLGFRNGRHYPPDRYPGIVVLRIKGQGRSKIMSAMRRVIRLLSKEPVSGRLWLVDPRSVRIRE